MKHKTGATQFKLPFAADERLIALAEKYGTPLFVHDEATYERCGREALAAPNAFGLSVRYAMKANSHRVVLRLFERLGIGIDASSVFEVQRALAAGIAAEKIQLTSQEVQPAGRLRELLARGIQYTTPLRSNNSASSPRSIARVQPRSRSASTPASAPATTTAPTRPAAAPPSASGTATWAKS